MVIRRRWVAVLAALASTAAFMSMPAVSSARVVGQAGQARRAGASATGSLSGVVRAGGAKGQTLRGVCVEAKGQNGREDKVGQSKTAGHYRIGGLPAGTYTVLFNRRGCDNNHGYLPLTRTMKIRIGQAVKGFNGFLKLGAVITGKITSKAGQPLAKICAFAKDSSGEFAGDGGATGSGGTYTINALPTGTYTVQFLGGQCNNDGSYAPQYYNGQANQGAASRIKLTAGQVAKGIDAVMQPGATITGTLTDPSGRSTDGTCVQVYPVSEAREVPNAFESQEVFPLHGRYQVANLAPGLYLVEFGCFIGGPPAGMAGQWGDGQPAASVADYVSAAGGAVTEVDATFSKAGTITGKVTDAAGHPVAGACVLPIPHGSPYPLVAGPFPTLHPDPNDSAITQIIGAPGPTLTAKNGSYRVGGLPPGRYDIQFSDCGALTHGGRWFPNAPTRQSGTPVQVNPGATVASINAVLPPGGSISGKVTDGAGHGGIGRCVTARNASGQFFGAAETGPGGKYTITGLASGVYDVSTFLPSCEQVPVAAGAGAGTPVTVTAPGAVASVNFTSPPTGSVSGTVRNAAGRRLDGACVVAVPTGPGGPALGLSGYRADYTAFPDRPDGTYQIDGLAPGSYRIIFDDPACLYQSRTQDEDYAPSESAPVTVTAGAVTANVSTRLTLRGQITGTVTGSDGTPVQGECVRAVPASQPADPYFGTTTAAHDILGVSQPDGTYSLIDLPPGQYQIEFSAGGCGAAGFATQWWKNASSQATATTITVAAGAAITGINAALSH